MFIAYIGCKLPSTRRWKAAATITGPNDATRVVWAMLVSFFISLGFFLLINVLLEIQIVFYQLHDRETNGRRETRRMGPNDAGRVVWAISKFFFSFLRVLLLLTTVSRYY